MNRFFRLIFVLGGLTLMGLFGWFGMLGVGIGVSALSGNWLFPLSNPSVVMIGVMGVVSLAIALFLGWTAWNSARKIWHPPSDPR